MVDACVHTDAYKRTEKDFDYKLYIMELAMEWVEEKCQIELSRSNVFRPIAKRIQMGVFLFERGSNITDYFWFW